MTAKGAESKDDGMVILAAPQRGNAGARSQSYLPPPSVPTERR
jgi:hypothetical protein